MKFAKPFRGALVVASVMLLGQVPWAHAGVIQYLDLFNPLSTSPEEYNLPGYGTVRVTVTGLPNTTSRFTQNTTIADNLSAAGHTWGTDADTLGFQSGGPNSSFQMQFDFLDPGLNAASLYLISIGLGNKSTATVSQAGTLAGEASLFLPAYGQNTSNTVLLGNTLASNYDNDNVGHFFNTGWALFQPFAVPGNTLSLDVLHQSGDGLGFTLGYLQAPSTSVPEPATVTLLGLGLLGVAMTRRKLAHPNGLSEMA